MIREQLSVENFAAFLKLYDTVEFRQSVQKATNWSQAEVDRQLAVYFNEMHFGFAFLVERLGSEDHTILEVGAGLGFLSLFLGQKGYSVIALEPGAEGFALFRYTIDLARTIAQRDGLDVTFLEIGAEDIDLHNVSDIDFAFSVNVVEHIAQLEDVFSAVIKALKPTGRWCNFCPNYIVPYEPHFGILLVPFAPKLSRRIFASVIQKDVPLWQSLNFVTALQVKRLSKKFGARATLEKHVLWRSLTRMGDDLEFAKRHQQSIAGRVFRLLQKTRTLHVLKYLPATLSTPMHFTVTPLSARMNEE